MNLRNLSIRKFRETDAERVSNIIRDNLTHVNCKDYPEDVIQYMHELHSPKYLRSISNKRKVYVALCEDVVVGTASIDDDVIYTVYTDIRYHRKGIGKKLMDLLEEIASNNGLRVVKLYASITAQKFYEKLGYIKIGEENSAEFGKGIIMEKHLV